MKNFMLGIMLWAASIASAPAQQTDLAADFAKLQKRVMEAQARLKFEQQEIQRFARLERNQADTKFPWRDTSCSSLQDAILNPKTPIGLRLSSKVIHAPRLEAKIDVVIARLLRINNLSIPRLCSSMVILKDNDVINAASIINIDKKSFKSESDSIQIFQTEAALSKTMQVEIGLRSKIPSDSEFAYIIGHELAHLVLHHHVIGIVDKFEGNRAIFDSMGSPYIFAWMEYVVATHKGLNQTQELEADYLGTIFARNAGYDPRGALDFLKRPPPIEFQAWQKLLEDINKVLKVPGKIPLRFINTHPSNQDRATIIEQQLSPTHSNSEAPNLHIRNAVEQEIRRKRDSISAYAMDTIYSPDARRGKGPAISKTGSNY